MSVTERWPGGVDAQGQPLLNKANDDAVEARRVERSRRRLAPARGLKSCHHECGCPSQMHHDLYTLKARIAAPIPPPSVMDIYEELTAILDADDEARKLASGEYIWAKTDAAAQ